MSDITIKSMIHYDRVDSKNKFKYKEVDATNPSNVKYEDGMFTFKFFRYFNVEVNGKIYYIVVDRDEKSYGFGMSETLRNIIERYENGEYFGGYDREIIDEYIKEKGDQYTFWVTGRNELMLDYEKNKIPVTHVYENTPDLELSDKDFITPNIEWYIEYKNYGEEEWNLEPTFCSDKEFRSRPDIEKYRFVKVAVYDIDGDTYCNVINREDTIYENDHKVVTRDYIDEALDAAKKLIYGSTSNPDLFSGYTRVYPFNTEDSSSVFRLQQNSIKDKECLTVTGSGDAQLDLFLYGAKSVTCFDINGMAKFYAILKFSFIKAGMSYQEYIEFFVGKGSSIFDKHLYDKYSSCLSDDLKRFWDGIYSYLSINNKKLLNSEHNIFYKIYDFFGSANQTFGNKSSYLGSEENYRKLQEIIYNKSLMDVKFMDSSLYDLPNEVSDKKYDYAYLSNILDFTEYAFESEDEFDRKMAFKSFILNSFKNIVSEGGVIDVGFVAQNWQIGKTFINSTLVFDNSEGFVIRDLKPYNGADKIIVYVNRKLDLTQGASLK